MTPRSTWLVTALLASAVPAGPGAAAPAPAAGPASASEAEVTRLPVGRDTTVTFAIRDSLPPYSFTLIQDAESNAVVRIDVRRDHQADPIQTLSGFPPIEPAPGGRDEVSVEDADFDGYADLKLLAWWGATGNRRYHYWRYLPATGRFAYDAALSALGDPALDSAARTIHTRSNGGMAGQAYTESTFAWIGGALELTRRERQDWDAGRNAFVRVIEEPRAGVLVPVRHGLRFDGEVTGGERYTMDLDERLYFELDPDPEGWEIAVRDADRPGENLARLTPPLHGPNPRVIQGWNFLRSDGAGTNEGDRNAPNRNRDFIFSEKVGRSIQGPASVRGPTAAEIETIGADGQGLLTIEDMRLDPGGPGTRPQLQWMRFTVSVDFP